MSFLYDMEHCEGCFNRYIQFLEPPNDTGSENITNFMVLVHLLHLRNEPLFVDILNTIDLRW